ncbi:uncharacterized protein DUF4410 [Cricetibacter osteomyelitidis]|uniref:Uncharacterized protein DUF4410 n=1 Tax=Cricetibacter osteomyelitidis TaxID=1521931 RepID=A0A4R2SMB8_9PAST|nr:DUF4410 domain-containing protein [Cricetibacter osteomyelitidis]TCP91157.1 uncharacterized protein DUF4410 [Cricetibacter osteomyelitidis]
MKKLVVSFFLSVFFITGCSSLKSETNLARNPDQNYYSYSIKNNSSNEIVDKKVTDIFEEELSKQLQRYGYQVESDGGDVIIGYDIKAYSEGNRALRMLVGFGVGKSNLEVITSVTDKNGKLLGSITSKAALKMGFFGGSLASIIRKTAKNAAVKIYKSRILTAPYKN